MRRSWSDVVATSKPNKHSTPNINATQVKKPDNNQILHSNADAQFLYQKLSTKESYKKKSNLTTKCGQNIHSVSNSSPKSNGFFYTSSDPVSGREYEHRPISPINAKNSISNPHDLFYRNNGKKNEMKDPIEDLHLRSTESREITADRKQKSNRFRRNHQNIRAAVGSSPKSSGLALVAKSNNKQKSSPAPTHKPPALSSSPKSNGLVCVFRSNDPMGDHKPESHSACATNLTNAPCNSQTHRPRNNRRRKYKVQNSADNMSCSIESVEVTPECKIDTPFVRSLDDFIVPSSDPHSSKKVVPVKQLLPIQEAPNEKIGKQREAPKVKRPTRLKKAILLERSIRREKRSSSLPSSVNLFSKAIKSEPSKLSPTSQAQPPEHQENTHFLTTTISSLSYADEKKLVSLLLEKLATYQDRAYVNYAHSAFLRKRTKRFVCGVREVIKHLKLKRVRIILVASNLEGFNTKKFMSRKIDTLLECSVNEDCPDPLALESALEHVWQLATSEGSSVPIFITHKRRELAKLCHKPTSVSVVAIINLEGAEDIAQQLLALHNRVGHTTEPGQLNE